MFLGHVACAECKDVALCYRYRLASPFVSVVVSPTKTAEPVKMPFGLWTRVGPRNRVLGGGVGRWENGQFWGCSNIEMHCNCDNRIYGIHTHRKRLASVIYKCSLLPDTHLHLHKISSLEQQIVWFTA